jgi:hypothetical protein
VLKTVWTKERVIAEMHRWVEIFGRPPGAMDWDTSLIQRSKTLTAEAKARKLQRYQGGNWPSRNAVTARFGSWSAGLRAAGLASNPTGGTGHWERNQVPA